MLKLDNITKMFNKMNGIKEISLEINEGDFIILVGQNGSGKSTILKLIGNIINLNKNDQGKIINTFQKIVYLPEKNSLPKLMTAVEYLQTFFYTIKTKCNVKEVLQKYLVPNKRINTLSKGMLQKILIIQTIYSDADLFLLDEPMEGLDDFSRKIFKLDLIELLEKNKTIIISTHNQRYFKELNSNNYRLKEGQICSKKIKK